MKEEKARSRRRKRSQQTNERKKKEFIQKSVSYEYTFLHID